VIPLTPGELEPMRDVQAAALPDLCTIHRYSSVSDGAGGQTETWLADGASVACRVAPSGGAAEQQAGARTALVQRYVATLATSTTLPGPRDRVVWETQSRTFEVEDRGGRSWATSRRVRLVEVV
jgi:hypothetical protein